MFISDHNERVDHKFYIRREYVFLVLTGIFLGSLTMLNILGLSKLVEFNMIGIHIAFPVGLIAYPITFLCTDFISEVFGRKRANAVVWVGLLLNAWVLVIIWIGDLLPPHVELFDQNTGLLLIPEEIRGDPNLVGVPHPDYIFYQIKTMTFAATTASMLAYVCAQFVDVKVFHFLKKLTKGKHLWLRNNGSTLVSQLIDSFAVILIAHYLADAFHFKNTPGELSSLMRIIFSSYAFKLAFALADTIPFYLGVKFFNKYLHIKAEEEY
jgi:uncharacterized PurR-regulated membrane protein YhhQ (DUF165 family)